MLTVTQTDVRRVNELAKILGRAKIEVEGTEEALALGQVMAWAAQLKSNINKDWADQQEAQQARITRGLELLDAQEKAPVDEAPAVDTEVSPKVKTRKGR